MCSGDPLCTSGQLTRGCVLMNTFIALLLVDGMHLSTPAAMQDLPLVDSSGLHEESVSLPGTPTIYLDLYSSVQYTDK